jgi:hypothetical protein
MALYKEECQLRYLKEFIEGSFAASWKEFTWDYSAARTAAEAE